MKIGKNWIKTPKIKIACYSSVIMNSICGLLGIFYLFSSSYSILWDFLGIILLITIFSNLVLVFINSRKRNGHNRFTNKFNIFGYVYLTFIIIAMVCMMLGNLLVSVTYSNQLIDNLLSYILIYLFYFGILIIGIVYAIFGVKTYNKINLGVENHTINIRISRRFIKVKSIFKKIAIVISRITFIIGIIFGIVILFGSFEIVTTFIAIVSGQFGIFFSIIFFANTIILLKLKHQRWNTKKFYRTALTGTLISLLLLTPLFLTQFTINNIERNFSSIFGPNWREQIPVEVNNYFLETPFSLSNYFLGIPPKDCNIEKDVLFYKDEGIELYFDAYMPKSNIGGLPGANSTIVRIHGGAWVSGDKGLMNMMQMNKYFAAQGYVVFDIQYGIADNPLYALDPLTPTYKKGSFNIDDMVRHIGIFTNYLTNHSEEYGANLDSVFFSGGSAGGHLSCAAALAIASGHYTDIFSANLTIKGLVPFYPANDLMNFFGLSGSLEFKNPENLIESDSPPCLIFQGTHDIINYFGISREIQDTYFSKGNGNCAILWMPFGGHASDFYFTGYYNQIFLYYMERFLYLNL
ncbi:MAG: alpha/beta hydrolase [Promethearchaeota archaeon]|nr:MAG: alpha/beta hydrolase [Candidatus Lokiarchaeota archaeon]